MRISLFGLGYVGTVSAACLTALGNEVVGVDLNEQKVTAIANGQSPVIEPGLDALLTLAVEKKRLSATTDPAAAVKQSDLSLICVGTPSKGNGGFDTSGVFAVAREIGAALRQKSGYHGVAVRSTVMPGTIERVSKIIAEASEKYCGVDFGVAANPEFLREGTAVRDFQLPPFTVVGATDERVEEMLQILYKPIDAPYLAVEIKVAEFLKYACNSFHAIKVTFANEIGALCKQMGIDSHAVMNLFVRDSKLNISPQYLRPGFAFGGSCLPKDLRALNHSARRLDIELPMLESVMRSNDVQIQRTAERILQSGKKHIGILGLSFKSDTDDLRESPIVRVVEFLIGKGCEVAIFDRNVNIARLVGANRKYIEEEIPHISCHMKSSPEEVVECSDLIVISDSGRGTQEVLSKCRKEQVVLDLVHVPETGNGAGARYDGLYW